jgi:hypothetical protein
MEITIETTRLVIRRNTTQAPVWCSECSLRTQLITPEDAAELAGVNVSTINHRVEQGQLHLIEPGEQSPLICLNSLLRTDKGENNHVTGHIIDHHNRD